MSETIHQQMRRKAAQPNPFDSPSGRYVVMGKSKATGEWEPVHPGHIDRADAVRLVSSHPHLKVWTDEHYNEEQDRIAAEVFCGECGEERELCKCAANARLMAAAPEMLNALKAVKAHLDWVTNETRRKWSMRDQRVYEAVAAALIEAEL